MASGKEVSGWGCGEEVGNHALGYKCLVLDLGDGGCCYLPILEGRSTKSLEEEKQYDWDDECKPVHHLNLGMVIPVVWDTEGHSC